MPREREASFSYSEYASSPTGLILGSKSSPSIKSSIESVPPEVLLFIFQPYIFDCREAYRRVPKRFKPYAWFKILHVCRLWRSIVSCETRFWTWMVPTAHPQCVAYIISHAGVRPLCVEFPSSGSFHPRFTSSAIQIMKELPRIENLSCSPESWARLLSHYSELASLDAPILETLSLSTQSPTQIGPGWTLKPLPKLKTLVAERLSDRLLVNLARPTLTTLVLRHCTCKGHLILEMLAKLPSLHRLSLQSNVHLEISSATNVSLHGLRQLQIVDHWLSFFCQNLSLSWSKLRLEILPGPFLTTHHLPFLLPSDHDVIYGCINSLLITPIRHANSRSGLDIHFRPQPDRAAIAMVTWGSEHPNDQVARSSFSFTIRSSPIDDPLSKHLEHFFNSISLPNTVRLSIDMVLPPALWRSISCTYLDKVAELHLSDHAIRSFLLACNTFKAPALFPVLKTLQLTTAKFAVDTRKGAKPYDVLKNLQMALSSRKRKGLSLQVLRIIYEGVLADEERAALETGGLAERLEIR